MGKLRNIVSAKISGNVGSMSFRDRGADVVVAERSYTNSSKGTGATEKQRIHRSRLANIVNFFRGIKAIESRAWEGKDRYVSDFNRFTSLNLASSPIFLTKQEAALGACIIAPYGVSRGSLAPCGGHYDDTAFVTDIVLASSFSPAEATVADLAKQIVDNNPGWAYNDKLSCCFMRQINRTLSGATIPQVEVIYFELTLDAESTTRLDELINWDSIQPDNGGHLQFLDGGDAAFAIHSREVAGALFTSEQDVVMRFPANAVYTKYSSEAQMQAAMDSYGYKEDVLLNPYSEVDAQTVVPAYVSSVNMGENALVDGRTYTVAGTLTIAGEGLSADNVVVMKGTDAMTPATSSATSMTWAISDEAAYSVIINGNTAYTFQLDLA